MKKLLALAIILIGAATLAHATGVTGVVPNVATSSYCLPATPTTLAGEYIATGSTTLTTAASGVGTVVTITDRDATAIYVSTVDTSVSGVTTVSACAIKQ